MKGEASALSAAFRTAVLYGLSREGASQEFSRWAWEGYAAFPRGMEQGQVSRVPAAVGGGAHGQSQDFFRSVHRTGRNGILHRQGEVVIDKSRFHGSCLVRMASPSSSNKWTAQDWHGS